jgi:hypothetical protein
MTRSSGLDAERLGRVLEVQYRVISIRQAQACGLTRKALAHRLRDGGPWQRLLPGVYLASTGAPAPSQRDVAALLYAGPRSVITGPVAVRRHRMSPPGSGVVDVLVPLTVRRQNVGFVRLHRTSRMPPNWYRTGPVRFTEPARAVADAARGFTRFGDVRAVVCEVLQRRLCSLGDLVVELNEGPSAHSGLLRRALAEVGDGVRSAAEADYRLLIGRSRLPMPMFNAKLYDLNGVFIAMVDSWWADAGVAGEVDSRAYHTSEAAQDRDTDRHDKLIAHGIFPMHFKPRRIRTEGQQIVAEIEAALAQGRKRPRLPIIAVPVDEEPAGLLLPDQGLVGAIGPT